MAKNKKKSLLTLEEEEVFCLTDGYCFGEWGLIYKKPRSTAALVTEDTHLFVLDEASFNLSFLKCLTKSETDRKNFFLNRIKPFADLQYLKFDSIFKTFVPMFLKNNQMIFLENSPADKLFVVYMGSCSLQKNINILPEQYKNDVNKMKFITLLKIEKGDITGLDALFEKSYKYSLRADSDYTVVFSIQVHKIEDSLKDKLKSNFQSIHHLFSEHVKSILDKKRQLAIRNKLNYRSNTIKKQINNMKLHKDEEKDLEYNIGKKIEQVKDEYKKDPLNSFNKFKVFSNAVNKNPINYSNLSSRSLYDSPLTQRKKENLNKANNVEFCPPEKKREHSSVAYSINLDNFHLNKMLNSQNSINSQYNVQNSAKNLGITKSLILSEGKNLNIPEEEREQNISFPELEENLQIFSKNPNSKFYSKSKENKITDYTGLDTNIATNYNIMTSPKDHQRNMLIEEGINVYEKRRNSKIEKAKDSINKDRDLTTPKIKFSETMSNFNSFNYKSKHPSIHISEGALQNMIKTPQTNQPRGSFSTKAGTFLRTNTVTNFHSSSSLNQESKYKGRSKNMITQGIQTTNNTLNDSNVSRAGNMSRRSSKSTNKFYFNTTTKESEPLTLSKTVKNNLVSWTNVMSNGKSFNTGYYDIPLIGMMIK
jgi:CRP-like cAMP-binding protein